MTSLPKSTCCDLMPYYIKFGEIGVIYNARTRDYGFTVRDGGSSYIHITFCPWCGAKLPGSLTAQFFRTLDKLGIDLGNLPLPPAFRSDAWQSKKPVRIRAARKRRGRRPSST